MKHLLMMRHAKSSWDDASLADHDRPLNKRGQRDAPRMGRWLAEQNLIPDLIICSFALRAHQTALAVASELNRDVEVVSELYLADIQTWKTELQQHSSPDIVLAIGHNPGIEEFVQRVAGQYERMPTAAIAHFELDNSESEFSMDRLSLKTIWRPKEIERT